MLTFGGGRIFLVAGATDMRKSIDGLAAITKDVLEETEAIRYVILEFRTGRSIGPVEVPIISTLIDAVGMLGETMVFTDVDRHPEFLDSLDLLDDTLGMVLSDNGASREGGPCGVRDEFSYFNGMWEDIDAIVERIDLIGLANSVIDGVDLPKIANNAHVRDPLRAARR